jgi:hypothetical protein
MLNLITALVVTMFLPPGGDRLQEHQGIVRVQVDGAFRGMSRLLDDENADVFATVVAGGGEFSLDFRGCPDGQNRLNEYFKNNMGGPGRVDNTKVKVSGQLEFRPRKPSDDAEAGVSAPLIPFIVVDSFSILEADCK